jgi:UDP-N-acetylglucosamine 1-carboxyvinyltransferase
LDKFIIRGGKRLSGRVKISGAKNATLALMPAALLAGGTYRLKDTPVLRDVATMSALLRTMGVKVEAHDGVLTLETSGVHRFEAPYSM